MSWKTVTLGELCEVLDSKRKPITKRDRTEGNYPYYGATGIVDYVGDYIFDEKLVLIGEDGAKWNSGEKTAFIADGKYWVNNHAHVIKPIRTLLLDEWLVYYFLFKDLKEFVTGLTVPKLNQSQLKNIPIPLPPLPIQQKIVAKLDAIFSEIDKATVAAEANVKNAEALFQSYLSNLFLNNTKENGLLKLSDLCEFKQGIQVDVSKQSDKLSNGKVRFLRIVDFTAGNETPRYIDSPGGQYFVGNNDVSLVRYGASTGFVCKGLEGVIANNLFQVKPKTNSITKEYLFWYLYSPKFQNFIKEKMSGAAMPAINFGMINNFEMNLLPIEEQELIVKNCENFNSQKKKLISIYQSKVSNFEVYRQSILKQAFNGELVKAA